jgi:hypothetical protein
MSESLKEKLEVIFYLKVWPAVIVALLLGATVGLLVWWRA